MSEAKKYRQKPVIIEAMELTENAKLHVASWILDGGGDVEVLSPFIMRSGGIEKTHAFQIRTLEGYMWAQYGDYVIKGVNGEFYPCKPDIFAKTYEVA